LSAYTHTCCKAIKIKRPGSEFVGVAATTLAGLLQTARSRLKFPNGVNLSTLILKENTGGSVVEDETYFKVTGATDFVVLLPGEQLEEPGTFLYEVHK
jgi:hypothetical protein